MAYAVKRRNSGAVALLCSEGVDVNGVFKTSEKYDEFVYVETLNTALTLAVSRGEVEMAEILLQNKADVNIPSEVHGTKRDGVFSPLRIAVEKGNFRMIALLVDYIGFEDSKSTLKKCKRLDLTDLNLEYLPLWVAYIREDAELRLKGNPLSHIPKSVKDLGTCSILQYLREIEKGGGKVQWKKVKVMVLGREGVGKTHLYQRMRGNKKYDQNISTNGVDINTVVFNGMELTWFDFGGQEVFYPTHQLFLTTQCVYLIVFRLVALQLLFRSLNMSQIG